MRRDVSQTEVNSCKKRIIEILFKKPSTPRELYAVMNPDAAYEALLSLTFEGKVRNENLTYFPQVPNQKPETKVAGSVPVNHGKPAEHRVRADKYSHELTDPNS